MQVLARTLLEPLHQERLEVLARSLPHLQQWHLQQWRLKLHLQLWRLQVLGRHLKQRRLHLWRLKPFLKLHLRTWHLKQWSSLQHLQQRSKWSKSLGT